jgi:hypothetical protein
MMKNQSRCSLMMKRFQMILTATMMMNQVKKKFIKGRKSMILVKTRRKIISIVVLACLAHKIMRFIISKILLGSDRTFTHD